MQSLINTPIKFNVKRSSVRFLFIFHLWGCLFGFLTVISFYVTFINLSIDGHQVTTKRELVKEGYRVAGDRFARHLVQEFDLVIFVI